MRSPRARLIALVFLLVIAGVTRTVEGRRQLPETFSRAAWIERHLARFPFSGGVVPDAAGSWPAAAGPVLADFFLLTESAAFVAPDVTPPLRVNNDLLPPGGGTNPESQAEPYVAVNPANTHNLLGVYQESRFRDGGARTLNYATSFDGGMSWTEGILPDITKETGGPWERASDPWSTFGPGNRAYYVTLDFNDTRPDNQIGVSISTDGGVTWTQHVSVFRSELDFNDKEAIEADNYPASRFFGNVYIGWDINIAQGNDLTSQHLVVARSVNGGTSFLPPVVLRTTGANIGAIPRVGPDGTVYVVWMGTFPAAEGLFIFFSKSTNGGATFSTPRTIHQLRSLSVPFIRDGSILPSFAVDRTSGDLYLVWADTRWTGVDQTTISYSRDGGATWSAPRRVGDGPDDAATFTAAVAVNGKGEVGVSYTSLENDPARLFLIDQYLSISRDRGVTFESRRRLSPVTSDIRFAAFARNFFLGDYTGIAGGDDNFHMLWVFPLLPTKTAVPPPTDSFLGTQPSIGVPGPSPIPPFRLQSDVFASRTR